MILNDKLNALVDEYGWSKIVQVLLKRKGFVETFSAREDWTKEAVCRGKTPFSIRSKNRAAGHYGRHADYVGTRAQLAQDRSR
jgi:hypothetical protein